MLKDGADQVSAFGQEPWAQQALAHLRRDWPDWAFLVVRHRWLAMCGKRVVISATGPQELRHALPSIPPRPSSTEPSWAGPGSAVSRSVERSVPEPGLVLPPLAALLGTELGAGQPRPGASPPPASALTAGPGGVHGGDGAGAALNGTLPAVAPPSGVMMAAERSATGTWMVAAVDRAWVAWLPRRWMWGLWGKRRNRSRPGSGPEAGARPAGRSEPVDGDGPRHRRARSRPSVKGTVVAA